MHEREAVAGFVTLKYSRCNYVITTTIFPSVLTDIACKQELHVQTASRPEHTLVHGTHVKKGKSDKQQCAALLRLPLLNVHTWFCKTSILSNVSKTCSSTAGLLFTLSVKQNTVIITSVSSRAYKI